MLILWVVGALSALLTFVFSALPDTTFLALPSEAYDAVVYVGGIIGWGSGLAGADIKTAFLTTVPLIIGVNVAVLLWQIVRKWKPPVIGKIL